MTIDGLQQFVRDLPHTLMYKAAPDVAKALHDALLETMRAQQAPDGTPWQPRKRGTAPVLVNAPAAFTAGAVGKRIYLVLRGIEARHHKGAVRGSVQRPIIIYKKHGAKAFTPRLIEAIRGAVMKHLEQDLEKAAA